MTTFNFDHLFKHNFAPSSVESALEGGRVVDGVVLLELLEYTKDALLPPDQMERLRRFLQDVPATADRRRKAQREEGAVLLALVNSAQNNCLLPIQMEYLCAFLEGMSLRPRGRPTMHPSKQSNFDKRDMLMRDLMRTIPEALRTGDMSKLPDFVVTEEPPERKNLPIFERAWLMTRETMNDLNLRPPSIPTLRNRLSKR